jgi:hypothetical protein
VSDLSEQNSALRKNISCLFKTAKLELGRKNAAITSLEKRQVSYLFAAEEND